MPQGSPPKRGPKNLIRYFLYFPQGGPSPPSEGDFHLKKKPAPYLGASKHCGVVRSIAATLAVLSMALSQPQARQPPPPNINESGFLSQSFCETESGLCWITFSSLSVQCLVYCVISIKICRFRFHQSTLVDSFWGSQNVF